MMAYHPFCTMMIQPLSLVSQMSAQMSSSVNRRSQNLLVSEQGCNCETLKTIVPFSDDGDIQVYSFVFGSSSTCNQLQQ